MKKRNQGILRQGKGLTSAVLITIMLLTGSLHGLAATNGFTFEDWIPCTAGNLMEGARRTA